jgi:hypothetical protein
MTTHRHLGTLRPHPAVGPGVGWEVLPMGGIAVPMRPTFAATDDLIAAGVKPANGIRIRYTTKTVGDGRSVRATHIEAA